MDTWIHSAPYSPLPPFAVVGGHDCDGSPIYVGRSFHEGDNLPAKVVPSKGTAYVCWGGVEIAKSHYEVLVGQGYNWVPCFGGAVPPTAVRSGSTRNGEPLYVGRGHHTNSLTVGKIHPSHGCLYIPFGGQEIRINTYEVLVRENRESWVASTPHYTPPGAVVAGHDTDRAVIYVGRAEHAAHKWLHSSAYSSIPSNAVIGGNDTDGAIMYVGRAFHNGDTLVAKVLPTKHIAYISWRGEEIAKQHFEVLCGTNLVWRHCYDHIMPENAVLCGKTALDQPVYIGRGHHEGSLTVGKISSVHKALFIPFKGGEKRLETYEILVEDVQAPQPAWSTEIKKEEKPAAYPELEASTELYPPPPPPYTPENVKPEIALSYSAQEMNPPPYSALPAKPFTYTPAEVTPAIYATAPAEPFLPPKQIFTPAISYQPSPTLISTPAHTHNPAYNNNGDVWISVSGSYIPPNALQAGHNIDLSKFFVARAFYCGDLIPGKAVPAHGCAYIPYAGNEVVMTNYEILIDNNYDWVPARDGNIAPGAIIAGHTRLGEPLYVGRSYFNGSLVPGSIQMSHRCLYIAHGGAQRINDYEVLVRRNDYYRDQAHQMFY